ncbi:MAG: response regulator, partial [Proteobacteria bacterium]|nr:response regulator [Pseudomonadota bacterium]
MSSAPDRKTILVVDDEEPVRALLRDCFELEGYHVEEASDARQALARIDGEPVQLVTLDLNLGGDNGLEVARQIRAKCNVPIVMVTGKSDTIDRVVGLELGADDYIAKPFHVREVLARVRAVLRRYETGGGAGETAVAGPREAGEVWTFGDWVLDIGRREFKSTAGDARDLTTAEFNMLAMFVRRPSRVLSRDNIMDALKGHDWSPLDRSIDSLVARLRKKIEEVPDAPHYIKTV